MSRLSKEPTKRLLAVHGWTGTVLGAFLYLIILTGAVAVFAHEIGVWSAGAADEHAEFGPGFDAQMKTLAASVDPAHLDEVQFFHNAAGQLVAFFHSHSENAAGQLEDVGTRFILDAETYKVIQRDEGFRSELPSDDTGALEEFIVQLHINLHIPHPWGLYATGLLGFVMLYAAVSGLLLHKHLIKDIFVAPRLSSRLLNRRDRHILAGSWSLPFGFILAFTGAFFSFATSLGLPVVAMVAFGGDQEKLIETVVGAPTTADETPALLANLDDVMNVSIAEAGTAPTFVGVSHWGRADAAISTFHPAKEGALVGDTHMFAGASGEYQGIKPIVGTKPSVSGDLLSLIGPLHFGNFGGLISKIVWLSLGLASCYVTITGLQLWMQRREEEAAWRWMSRAISVTTYGTPLALIGCALAYFAAIAASANASYWTAVAFLVVAGGAILLGSAAPGREQLRRWLINALIGGLVITPIARMILTGNDWVQLFAERNATVIGVDLVLWVCAAYLTWSNRIARQTDNATLAAEPTRLAAE
ncbi:MAG: PepSY-associated TM helix domain-containing protein [Pseudomonadota bacterium]